jgi:hypothetical protein
MTAETFIREKLIPWLYEREKASRNDDSATLAYNFAQYFIEQHKAEWQGGGE